MKKNYKRIFGYALVMLACVMIMVLVACLSENRLEEYQDEYNESMTLSQKQIVSLEQQIEKLEKENAELKKINEKNMSIGAEAVTTEQAFADLREIYEKYKSGKTAEAKAEFKKIEPIGFDDATLSYYELLSDMLKK